MLQNIVTHDGVFSVDSQQRILHWSPSAQDLLGYRSEDMIGKPCYEVIGGLDSRNNRFCRRDCPVIENARRGRTTPNYDVLCKTADGEQRWLNVSIAFSKPRGDDLEVVHFFRDVTDRRQTEEFARKAGSALRQLLDEGNDSNLEQADLNPIPLPKLSRRESEVLRLLAAGMTTRQMADTMGVKLLTARNHVTRVLTKLGVANRLQAIVYASQHRLI
ncbi:MAG: PAS and helix-turn-helix domain-containing protein [Chloroflexi bacterium]|nr:PAS and helix-turn-helix domain-containing protein [Chloroflexota bacterium]